MTGTRPARGAPTPPETGADPVGAASSAANGGADPPAPPPTHASEHRSQHRPDLSDDLPDDVADPPEPPPAHGSEHRSQHRPDLSDGLSHGVADRSQGDQGDHLDELGPYVPLASEPPVADTPMWLSHHWPDQYDRCAVVGRRHVCRRCLFMYPVALVAGVLAATGLWWPRPADAVLIPLLPLAAVIDFVLDNLGLVRYSGRRQAALSAVGALAAGAGYVRYLDRPGDPLVWGTVLVYGAACLGSVVVGHLRRPA